MPSPRRCFSLAAILRFAKGDGDAPVQAYIAAMPGWKSDVGRRLDALIVRTVPDVRKAVRWNSPWWGVEGQGWFVSCHVFTRYIKVTFMARRCDPCRPARARTRTRAGSTSTRASTTRSRWRSGSGRLPRCPGGRGFDGGVGLRRRRHPPWSGPHSSTPGKLRVWEGQRQISRGETRRLRRPSGSLARSDGGVGGSRAEFEITHA